LVWLFGLRVGFVFAESVLCSAVLCETVPSYIQIELCSEMRVLLPFCSYHFCCLGLGHADSAGVVCFALRLQT
jgi:hypothetical protein